MIDSSAPVEQPVSEQAPPAEQAVEQQEAAAVAPVISAEEEAELDAELAQQVGDKAIAVPDGERLISESLLKNVAIGYRKKLKEAKLGAPDLRQQLEQAQAQNAALAPLAEAFKALQAAPQYQQPQQQQAVQQPTEDVGELEAIAKDFDFYKTDGTPDLDKARRVQARTTKQATQIAQAQTAPLVQNTLQQQAQYNIERAKATKHPVTKQPVDPAILDTIVRRIEGQPGGLETLASQDAMMQIWLSAYGMTSLRPGAPSPAAQTQPPAAEKPAPPVFTERPGGQMPQPKELNTLEKKAAKEAGLSEKEYLDMAKGMKW